MSRHTCLAYEKDLEQFSGFALATFETKEISKATFREVRSWIASLSEQKLAATSINRKVASLRAFYNYLLKKGFIAQSPMLKVRSMKKPHRPPVFVEEEAMDQMMNATETFPLRDLLILELLYGTGIRLSELIQLKVKDIDLFEGRINVMGKRSKQRIIPLTSLLTESLRTYILKEALAYDSWLFLTDKGQPLYPVFVQRLVKKYLGMVSTQKKKSPHVLRHTFATHMLNRGAELTAIKELLGHASLSATQIYTHNTIEQLKAVHKQAHPKAG